jgi:hypothetical protein
LVGIDLSNAYLPELKLAVASLCDANFAGAILHDANRAAANLMDANLTEADLAGANLKDIRNWERISSVEYANIYGIKNPPGRFIEWAKEGGAVEIEDHYEWTEYREKKMQEKAKEKQ